MAVKFDGLTFAGTHGTAMEGSWTSQSLRRYYFGLYGQTEKRGGRGARELTVDITLHDTYSDFAALHGFLKNKLNRKINKHGTLEVKDDNIQQTFKNVTFDRFDWTQPPLADDAGTVDGGWWMSGVLRFTQLDEV